MSLRLKLDGPLPVTAPLVLNPLMARMVEAAGFPAGYLGGGASGYQKVALEANLNLTEMCQTAIEIGAVSSLPLIFDAACGFGDPMHMHRTIGMSEAAGFAAIEIEDQLVPKRAHHHIGIEHMIPMELMAAKVREAVAARRNPDFLIIARTNAMRASDGRRTAAGRSVSKGRRRPAAPVDGAQARAIAGDRRAAWRSIDVSRWSRRAGGHGSDPPGPRQPSGSGSSPIRAPPCWPAMPPGSRSTPTWPTASAPTLSQQPTGRRWKRHARRDRPRKTPRGRARDR